MSETDPRFAGDDPVEIFRRWMEEATQTEPADPNAIALATVDAEGLPNARIVLLKEILAEGFVFYTNYESAKGRELQDAGRAAFVCHWKSLGRQVRARGRVEREDGPRADAYYASRPLDSRIGAWASRQSHPLTSREALVEEVARLRATLGDAPPRPPFWGGFLLRPTEMELWADGAFRLHDRFRYTMNQAEKRWTCARLNP